MSGEAKKFVTVDVLSRIPWLVHGFGRAGFGEADFAADPGFEGFRPVIMKQVHSDRVHRLAGAPEEKPEGDALVTDRPGLLLVVRTADCLPVLLVDGTHRAVAAVHCGWRGTRARILERAVEAMHQVYGTEPAMLLAALGPCIGPCCYEVGPEVRTSFERAGFPASLFAPPADDRGGHVPSVQPRWAVPSFERHVPGSHAPGSQGAGATPGGVEKSLLDLRAANAWLLRSLGVPGAAIEGDTACTHCGTGLYSYRREPGERRRLYNFIGIRSD